MKREATNPDEAKTNQFDMLLPVFRNQVHKCNLGFWEIFIYPSKTVSISLRQFESISVSNKQMISKTLTYFKRKIYAC